MPRIFVSLVLCNSIKTHGKEVVLKSIDSILNQEDLSDSLTIRICDNGSREDEIGVVRNSIENNAILYDKEEENIGFSAAHNKSVAMFLESDCEYILFVNPDLYLYPDAITTLINSIKDEKSTGIAGAKLYRGDECLEVGESILLDSAGMELVSSLRHFDRGSNQKDIKQFDKDEYVFGMTGACLMLKKECVKDLILPKNKSQECLYKIYPQLEKNIDERVELFDESFFAYREDADLCWRANHFSWKCKYVSSAKGIHKRVVLSSNRKSLNSNLNYLGVRNRFLLQINNFSFLNFKQLIVGFIIRNLIVIFGVLILERSSLKAFVDVLILSPRSLKNRKYIFSKVR